MRRRGGATSIGKCEGSFGGSSFGESSFGSRLKQRFSRKKKRELPGKGSSSALSEGLLSRAESERCRSAAGEDDGIRTRNHRIDSPGL